MNPGDPDPSIERFALPAMPPSNDPGGGCTTPRRDDSRKDRSISSGGKSAQPPVKESVKNVSKSSDKTPGSDQAPRKRSDQSPSKNLHKASGPVQSREKKTQENPSGSTRHPKAAEGDRGRKTKPASDVKTPDKGKKQAAPEPIDTSKRPCPSGPPSPPIGPLSDEALAIELFGDDDDDEEVGEVATQTTNQAEAREAGNPAGAKVARDPAVEKGAENTDPVRVDTDEEKKPSKSASAKGISKHQTLVELHRDICQSRPWRRYVYTAEHFLPDVGESPSRTRTTP
ncbi:hypothetical protein AC1031_004113 [Aphanomyces cochlioides]|nr:hypothetical protein AC1031_004113 [Aphanomyces cochlioides]